MANLRFQSSTRGHHKLLDLALISWTDVELVSLLKYECNLQNFGSILIYMLKVYNRCRYGCNSDKTNKSK